MAEPGPESQPERPRAGCGAIALIVVGLLILIPSGLCTGFMTIFPIVMALSSRTKNADIGMFISLGLTVGLPFIVLGVFLIRLGFRQGRR